MFSKLSILALAAGAVAVPYYGAPSNTLTTAAPSQSFACNPAHEYPEGRKCVSQSGGLTLLPPTTTAVPTTYACNPAHEYPEGRKCVSQSGGLTLLPPTTSASATTYACNPAHEYPEGRKCVSQSGGLTLLPPTASASATGDVVVTQIVPVYTTYCPSPTTLTHGGKTYTITSATTLTITSCPGGCKVTTPVKSLPPATTITAIVPYTTTDCPTPTTITVESKTYTVSTSTVITVPCEGGCTITTPVSLLPPPATTVPVVVPSTTVAKPPVPTTSQPAVYTGAADKVAGSAALAVGALGLFFL